MSHEQIKQTMMAILGRAPLYVLTLAKQFAEHLAPTALMLVPFRERDKIVPGGNGTAGAIDSNRQRFPDISIV